MLSSGDGADVDGKELVGERCYGMHACISELICLNDICDVTPGVMSTCGFNEVVPCRFLKFRTQIDMITESGDLY
jgi:hypothetical protein